MLYEQCKILCSLSSSPRQITIPYTNFCKADMSICTCYQQDKPQILLLPVVNCQDCDFQVISSTVLIEEGEKEAEHDVRVTT